MLEFCADISSYLLNNSDSSVAIHCKAGKGRSGSMMCAYLIFSGIAQTSKEAMKIYAERRSYKKRGVTVPSQVRYLQHFETFLNLTYSRPFFKMIPHIFRMSSIDYSKKNLLHAVFSEKTNDLFKYGNVFHLKRLKIGPINKLINIDLTIFNFKKALLFSTKSKGKLSYRKMMEQEEVCINQKIFTVYYFTFEFLNNDFLEIQSDCEIRIEGGDIKFFIWANLFFISLEQILDFIKIKIDSQLNAKTFTRNQSKFSSSKEIKPVMRQDSGLMKEPSRRISFKKTQKESRKEKFNDSPFNFSSKSNQLSKLSSPASYRIDKPDREVTKFYLSSKKDGEDELEIILENRISQSGEGKQQSSYFQDSPIKPLNLARQIPNDYKKNTHYSTIFEESWGGSFSSAKSMKASQFYKSSNIYENLKNYLKEKISFNKDHVQSLDLKIIYSHLLSQYPDELNSEMLLNFTINSLGFDKYSGYRHHDLKLEIIYELI